MIELKYGLFSAFLIFILSIIEYTILVPSMNEGAFYAGILGTVLPLLMILPAIKERRNKLNFGYINFKEAFRSGLIISFMTTVMITVATYIYFEFVNKGLTSRLAQEVEQNLISSGVQRENLVASVNFVKTNYDLQTMIILRLVLILAAGTLISFISANLLKKSRRKHPISPGQ